MRETSSRSALRSSSSSTEETKSPPASPAKKRAKTKDEKSESEAESSAAPKKRGRPKKEELVAESPIEPAAAVSKRGKKKKDEESAAGTVGTKSPEAEPSSAPSKKGRKKKEASSDIDATNAATGEPTAQPSTKGKKRKSSTGSKSDAEGKGKKPAPVAPEWHHDGKIDVQLLPPDPPIPTDLSKLDYMAHYACQRASPLKCPNQALVEELDIMRRARLLEGEIRSELSYQKGISALKGALSVLSVSYFLGSSDTGTCSYMCVVRRRLLLTHLYSLSNKDNVIESSERTSLCWAQDWCYGTPSRFVCPCCSAHRYSLVHTQVEEFIETGKIEEARTSGSHPPSPQCQLTPLQSPTSPLSDFKCSRCFPPSTA